MLAAKPWLSELDDKSRAFDQKGEEELGKLSLSQLNWRPNKETWSVAQQLQHMVLANRPYMDILEKLASEAGAERSPYKPGFWGRFLIKAVAPGDAIPSPVPKPLIPSESPMDQEILKEYLELQKRFHAVVPTLEGKDLNGRFRSPLAGFVKLKLGDAVQIIALHNERHLGKAFALLERPDFPR